MYLLPDRFNLNNYSIRMSWLGAVFTVITPAAGGKLTFSAPTTLPLFCPQSVCKYGGSVGADTFVSFTGRWVKEGGPSGLA